MNNFPAPYGEISEVHFSILSDADHLQLKAVDVTSYELFGSGNIPVSQGVYDARMGTTDHHYACQTCELQKREDPGHAGVLRMRVALEGPLWIDEIRRWARVVCLKCGAPVVDARKYARVKIARRLNEAATATTEGVRCRECAEVHPKIVKADDDHFSFVAEHPAAHGEEARTQKLYPHDLKKSFERVSAATVAAFGRPGSSHPRHLIYNAIQVPPTPARPGVRMLGHGGGGGSGGSSSYHDTTNMVQYLVKKNQVFPEILPDEITRDFDKRYQNARELYYAMIKGSAATSPVQGAQGKRGIVVGTRAPRSIMQNIPRKQGRIRRNLLGCRVWRISRSTISGNPLLRTDEVGFPIVFARRTQIEETVREYNRERLMVFFLNGRGKYPGCTQIRKKSTGETHRADGLRRDFRLELGDIVFRDVVTGDPAFFNRQPSLERSSIGVHRIVVLEDENLHTFQMNVTACAGYGADFNIGVQQVAALLAEKTPAGVNSVSFSSSSWGYNHLVILIPRRVIGRARLPNCGNSLRACATKRMQ